MNIKPQLAEDAQLDSLILPCWVQPKIDGVRAMNLNGTLTGRSLDPFAGFGITDYFSKPEFLGLDGEMTLGDQPNSPDRLCSLTTGAMGRFKGVTEMADLHWWVFDYLTPETIHLPYADRFSRLRGKLWSRPHPRVHVIPRTVNVGTQTLLESVMTEYSEAGFEGTILRNPNAPYKSGRATKKGQELWRIKPWADFEILVTGLTEGQSNGNAAKTNSLGRTERSSAQNGMTPNGQVGSVQGTLVKDLVVNGGALTLQAGTPITAGSGRMTVEEARFYWQYPQEIVGQFAKVKTMTFGVKDLPRFPTFEGLRLAQDMS